MKSTPKPPIGSMQKERCGIDMDTRSFMLGALIGNGGGGGGKAGTKFEDGEFTVSSSTTDIPVQMEDYDVLIAFFTGTKPFGNTYYTILQVEWFDDVLCYQYAQPTLTRLAGGTAKKIGGGAYGKWKYVAVKYEE